MAEISVRNEELRTTREVAREINAMMEALAAGDVEKFVITRQGKIVGVLVSPEKWTTMQQG